MAVRVGKIYFETWLSRQGLLRFLVLGQAVTEREEEGVTDFPLYFLLFLLIYFAFEFYHVRHVSFQISNFIFFYLLLYVRYGR
jgi:hypothetical protein